MQKRTESNIRDKRLVKMVKLQVKTETKRIAEMLNEMNPKLKALLAAGLIGTAGLGMQSCSNPSDSVYYPYTVEAPSTDNPGSGGAETSNPSGGEENGGNGRETVNKNEVTFEKLGVKDTDDQRRIKNATSVEKRTCSIKNLKKDAKLPNAHVYFYIMGENPSFKNVSDLDDESDISMELIKYYSKDSDKYYYYYIPANILDDFIKAGAPKLVK